MIGVRPEPLGLGQLGLRHLELGRLGLGRLGLGRRLGAAGAAVLAAGLSLGCDSQKLTEGDCALIKDRIEKAWERDAIAAQRLADTEQFSPFIREESDRIGEAWMTQCKTRVGTEVTSAELDCLNAAQTIDDVYACAR